MVLFSLSSTRGTVHPEGRGIEYKTLDPKPIVVRIVSAKD
jgi:hypothetical protein